MSLQEETKLFHLLVADFLAAMPVGTGVYWLERALRQLCWYRLGDRMAHVVAYAVRENVRRLPIGMLLVGSFLRGGNRGKCFKGLGDTYGECVDLVSLKAAQVIFCCEKLEGSVLRM